MLNQSWIPVMVYIKIIQLSSFLDEDPLAATASVLYCEPSWDPVGIYINIYPGRDCVSDMLNQSWIPVKGVS